MKPFNIFDPTTSIRGKYFLEASAGTGKTFTLEHIVLRAILDETVSHTENILAVTFTKAAANELKNRIRENLKQARKQLHLYLAGSPCSLPAYLKDTSNVKLLYIKVRNALATLDRMSIFTIHGFCNHILQKHFPEIQITTENSLLTHTQSIAHHIRSYLSRDLWLSVLFPEQYQLLASRYHTNFKNNSFLVDALLANYTKRVQPLPSKSTLWKTLTTWHRTIHSQLTLSQEAFLAQALNYISCFKKQPFSIEEELRLFSESLYSHEPTTKLFSFSNIAETFHPKNRLQRHTPCPAFQPLESSLWQQHTEQFCHIEHIFHTLLHDVQNYLKKTHHWCLSPDESISLLHQLVCSEHTSPLIDTIRSRYQLVLIDEFQDTDSKQWVIFSTLFSHDHFSGSLFLIGDPKQSIYEWRNADLATYLKAKSSFPEEAQLHLTNNYRSTPQLMEAINTLFTPISPFLQISGYPPIHYHPLHSQSTESFKNPLHSPIHFFTYDSIVDQAAWITATAKHLQATHNIALGDMVILVTDSSQAFELMTHCDLPLAFSKNKSILYLTETYYLTILWLEAILHPELYTNIQKIALTSLYQLSPSQLEEKKETLTSYFFSLHAYLLEHGLLATFYHFISLQGESLLLTPQGDLIFQEMERLCAYLDAISSQPDHQLLHLHQLYETGLYEDKVSFSSYSEDPDTLKITTIHASKGLEYTVVFCPGLDKSKKTKTPSEWMREMYVACTRARKQLFIPLHNAETKRNSALSQYLKTEGSFSSTLQWSTHLSLHSPHLFSLSSSKDLPISDGTPPLLTEPETFSLPVFPCQEILSFSSTKSTLDPDHVIKGSSTVMPKGKETGILIHKILDTITPHFYISRHNLETTVSHHTKHTHLEGFEHTITDLLFSSFNMPLPFSSDTFSLKDISPNKIFSETPFLFSHHDQLWQGVIDLFFEYNSRYYLLDWKTSFLGDDKEDYSQERMLHYLQETQLEHQGHIYTHAAQMFLQQFDISTEIEMGFFFIRGAQYQRGFIRLNPTASQKYLACH